MRTLLLVYLIVEAIYGVGFLFVPTLMMDPMGVTLDETSTTFARLFGSLLISIPVLLFFFSSRVLMRPYRRTIPTENYEP